MHNANIGWIEIQKLRFLPTANARWFIFASIPSLY